MASSRKSPTRGKSANAPASKSRGPVAQKIGTAAGSALVQTRLSNSTSVAGRNAVVRASKDSAFHSLRVTRLSNATR